MSHCLLWILAAGLCLATRFVVIHGTTHDFEAPGRQAVAESVSWIQKHLGGRR